MDILKDLPGVKKNILLASYTTFKIGGLAKYFFLAKSKEDIIKAVKAAKKNNLPFFILGSGSNILVSDEGFDGLIIKTNPVLNTGQSRIKPVPGQVQEYGAKTKNFTLSEVEGQKSKIIAEAGVLLSRLVTELINHNLTGLERLIGIPGTIAGAVCGNASAYGHSISESVVGVQVLTSQGKVLNYTNKDCQFAYRSSIFKKNKEIILEVLFQFTKGNKEESQKQIKKYLKIRKNKIPIEPSAGSIFKNIEQRTMNNKQLKLIPKEKIKNGMVPAGYLIEQCGLKNKQIGKAKISQPHANFIVNLGRAKAKDVIALIKLCKKEVKNKFKVNLEEEIRYVGFTR